ncbi:MAG: hypothetical protein CEE38_07515 [Planctomycetes bacterium B3_Pla]|nr:MAG: hypothetical protein CEE38_07515 [Planctomycetes bacterium B3_Pla]
MSLFLIIILVLLVASAVVIFPGLRDRSKLSGLAGKIKTGVAKPPAGRPGSPAPFRGNIERQSPRAQEFAASPDMTALNCRIQLTEVTENNISLDAFGVEICGTIHVPDDMNNAILRVSILDITDGPSESKPVRSGNKNGTPPAESEAPEFCHEADLGRLPQNQKVTMLSNWTPVAKLPANRQVYPRKGGRSLQFNISILSANDNQALAHSQCTFAYKNRSDGYMDLQENTERTNVLAVALAFAVSAANNKLYECEVELIKNWARDNILDNSGPGSNQARQQLDTALNTTVAFFSKGSKFDMYGLCDEIVEIASVAQRCDILSLCLCVAQASGTVSSEEIAVLKGMANWLEIDSDRFRAMMEKALPVNMHEALDVEDVLGITSDMSKEMTRKLLNKQFSKWNYRVTNADPEIQSQADQMLKLIAGARGQYVTEDSAEQEPAKTK